MPVSRSRLALTATVVACAASAAIAGDGDCHVIVKFKGDADTALLSKRGVDVESVRGRLAAGTIPALKIAQLRAESAVAYVEEDGIAEASAGNGAAAGGGTPSQPAQTTPGGITSVWGGSAPSTKGAGIKVATIDTGINHTHPDLQANIAGSATFVPRTSTAEDDNGHGDHVAGTIAALDNTIGVVGVAPRASLYAAKVLDKRGSGRLSDVAAGIAWAVAQGAHVANMSLGSSSDSITLHDACDDASDAGLLLVAAAGNSGDGSTSTTETGYPAAYSSVVAVGAIDSSDHLASFSNTGAYVALCAPGVSILSTYKSGGYATLSGTSMACPHVVGVAALVWAEFIAASASPTNASVRAELQTRVRDLGATGRDAGFGFGAVDYSK